MLMARIWRHEGIQIIDAAVVHVLVLQGAAESLACIKEHAYSRI